MPEITNGPQDEREGVPSVNTARIKPRSHMPRWRKSEELEDPSELCNAFFTRKLSSSEKLVLFVVFGAIALCFAGALLQMLGQNVARNERITHAAESDIDYEGPQTASALPPRIPLHIAAQIGNTDEILQQLKNGADVNEKTSDGYTPLMAAASAGRYESVKLLLKHGADMKAKGPDGNTCLHFAAIANQVGIVQLFLERGMVINSRGQDGLTPLHLAIHRESLDTAYFLIGRGANVNARTDNGWTPLHIAVQKRQNDIARLLLDNGADVTIPTDDGILAAQMAEQDGNMEIARMLWEAEALKPQKNNH